MGTSQSFDYNGDFGKFDSAFSAELSVSTQFVSIDNTTVEADR